MLKSSTSNPTRLFWSKLIVRNSLLTEPSDWTWIPDSPLSEKKLRGTIQASVERYSGDFTEVMMYGQQNYNFNKPRGIIKWHKLSNYTENKVLEGLINGTDVIFSVANHTSP